MKKMSVNEEVKYLQEQKLKLAGRLSTKTCAGQKQIIKEMDRITYNINNLLKFKGFNIYHGDY